MFINTAVLAEVAQFTETQPKINIHSSVCRAVAQFNNTGVFVEEAQFTETQTNVNKHNSVCRGSLVR